jgi:selenocysteine-specific elongation factor
VTDVGARIIEILGTIHEEQPFRAGVPIAELSTRLGRKVASQVASRAASQLKGAGKLQAGPDGYHLPGHQPFGGGGSAAREAVLDALATAGLAPPSLSGLETASGLKPKALKELLSTLTRTGDVIKASASLYFGKQSFERARDELLDHIESAGELTTADAKAKLDISRKYLIPLLETLDRLQITVRVGEVRKAKNPRSA